MTGPGGIIMAIERLREWVAGLAAAFLVCSNASAQWALEAEGGRAWSGYNDVRIPGDTGTRFSLSRDLAADAAGFVRGRLTWRFLPRHSLSLLAAPFRLYAAGALAGPLDFNGERFAPGVPLRARYTFNSWRLTYRYLLVPRERVRLEVGFTAKVRDAGIRVEGGGRATEKSNVGFVPLLNFLLDWRFAGRLGLRLEGDALAAPQGRAEDVFLGVTWAASPGLSLKAGYRVLEGGADNDEVYTFALVHFLALGAVARF